MALASSMIFLNALSLVAFVVGVYLLVKAIGIWGAKDYVVPVRFGSVLGENVRAFQRIYGFMNLYAAFTFVLMALFVRHISSAGSVALSAFPIVVSAIGAVVAGSFNRKLEALRSEVVVTRSLKELVFHFANVSMQVILGFVLFVAVVALAVSGNKVVILLVVLCFVGICYLRMHGNGKNSN